MPEMAGVLRTRAAEETSALAPAAGASFSSRPASQRLDCGRGWTRIQNFISVSVVTRSVHADSPLEHNAFSSKQGRHCEQGSGEASQGSERRRSFRTGLCQITTGERRAPVEAGSPRRPSPSEDGRLSTHFCPSVPEVRSINSERRLTWRTHPLILRSEAKSRVSKDAPEGGARTGAYWSVLRGHFAAPQDEDVGMQCAELQNRDNRPLWIWNRAGLARARRPPRRSVRPARFGFS